MAAVIRVRTTPGEHRIAVVEDGQLLDYAIWRPGAPDELGALHQGRVTAAVPAMAGFFVAIEGAEGFLPETEAPAALGEGDSVTVRVTRTAQGGKGPRLSARVPQGDGVVRQLVAGPSPLAVLAEAHPAAPIGLESRTLHASLAPVFGARLHFVAPAWDDTIESDTVALESPEVALPGGMRATIVPTPALVAIDVDGGATTAARGGKLPVHLAANAAAIPALARQIRLRNLAGAILIDFAGLPARRRPALHAPLQAALAADPGQPRLLGFTALGLAEIVRPRRAPPLHEQLAGPHAAGLAALAAAAHRGAGRVAMDAAPAVVAALARDAAAIADAAALGLDVALRVDASLPANGWRLA